jgi:hypothetical protein
MKRTAGRLVAAAVLLTASACGGSSPDGNPLVAQLQGTWESLCEPGPSGSGSSDKGIGTYSGREYSSGLRNYGNETCSGTGGALRFGATYRISNVGSPVTVNLGSTPVTAYPVDWEHHYYTLLYVDTTAAPNRLYSGDPIIGGNDGSSAEKRPTALNSTTYMVRQ